MDNKSVDGSKVISERMLKAIEVTGMTQTQIARSTGYSRVYINQIVRGTRGDFFQEKALLKIAKAMNISPQWLLYGEGDIYSLALGYAKGQCFDLDKNLAVAVYTNDAISLDENNTIVWGKPANTAFIPNQLVSTQTGELKGLIVEEQNMSPSLCEDDLAVIDPTKIQILDGRVYAFMYEGKISFRRVMINLDGSYTFMVEYPMKSSMQVPADEVSKFVFLGMVLCKISFNI